MQTLVKRHGVVMAEEIAAFVNEQIYALKEVVEAEGIDCEFELRRSYDVFIDQKEAEEATRFFREGVKAKAKWVRNVDLVGQKYVERVRLLILRCLSIPAVLDLKRKHIGYISEGCKSRLEQACMFLVAIQVCHWASGEARSRSRHRVAHLDACDSSRREQRGSVQRPTYAPWCDQGQTGSIRHQRLYGWHLRPVLGQDCANEVDRVPHFPCA